MPGGVFLRPPGPRRGGASDRTNAVPAPAAGLKTTTLNIKGTSTGKCTTRPRGNRAGHRPRLTSRTRYAPQGVASPTPFYIYRRTSLQSSRSRRSTACPSMLTVRPTPLPPIHCTSWIMRTPLVLQWGFTVGSCCRDLGPLPCGQTILELGDVISCAPPRPRRWDLVCSSAAIGLHHADDACPPETCAQQISMRSRRDLDACPPETCAQPPRRPAPRRPAPRRPVPSTGTTAPRSRSRSRSDFRCTLANEMKSRIATSHHSDGGRRAHLPYLGRNLSSLRRRSTGSPALFGPVFESVRSMVEE